MSYHTRPRHSKFVPKPKDVYFEVRVIGGSASTRPNSYGLGFSTAPKLEDVGTLLSSFFSCEKKESDVVPSSSSARYVKYKLKQQGFTKPNAFELIRQTWCTKVCKPGYPFWLESAENINQSFAHKTDTASRQVLQPRSFSFGSFVDRGTFLEHYSTSNNISLIEDEMIQSVFEHDTKTMAINFNQLNPQNPAIAALSDIFPAVSLCASIEHRVEFEYKQFEEYVVVDENSEQGRIDLYIPLKWPPKVSKGEMNGEHTNYVRCTHFLNCTREVLGKSSVLRLRFDFPGDRVTNLPMRLVTRLGKLGLSVYFAAIRTKPPRGETEVPAKPSVSNFKVNYALECLLSRGFKVSDRVSRAFYDILRKATSKFEAIASGTKLPSTEEVCRALYHLIAFVENDRFCPLEEILEQLLFGGMRKKSMTDFELPKHYVYVARIIITPTQDYLVQPELVAENRVIREYGHKFAMRIAFREEDFSKLTSSYSDGLRDVLRTRVRDLLTNGIQLSERKFDFLACSNSQLRDHGAWLYAFDGEHDAADIRESLGELEDIRCVASFVSRMGQCFSSTKKSVEVSIASGVDVKEIPDIEQEFNSVYFKCCGNYRSGTYIFSDGIGKISKALARKVAKSLGQDHTPSAFQIRYAGCKGMLALDSSLPGGDTQEILLYRKSMSKFQSRHKALEICESTKPNLVYLNRQCITLLSGLGVPDEAFIRLQDTMLMRLASMLLFETVAMEALNRANVAGGLKVSALRHSGINVTCEPFFRSMLLAIYRSKLGDLLRRARIAIPQSHGRLMMGVLDETGTLEYGQVFIRYTKDISEPGKEITTLRGDVVVSKNPCFHPGDMRKFKAVDVPVLHHLVDCIVFPSKGPRPHTDEMSGSDLDGDKYFVTWYDELLPHGDNVDPMDFASPPKKVLNRKVEVSDMIQFVSDYIKNDQLGIIANAHLVHADSDKEGIFSSECIKLAHMHSDAVDFPKTGECPSLTQELRPEQYPDFMMKVDKPKYKSERVLGKLFRKCNLLERARRFMAEAGAATLKVDQDLILEEHQQYIEDAIEKRDRYNTKLGALMSLYGLKNEGEVVTGCLLKVNSRLSGKTNEKFEVAQMIQASLASLRNKLRNDFYEEFGGEQRVKDDFEKNKMYSKDVLSKASAWYVVTYNNMPSPDVEVKQDNEVLGGATREARDDETGNDVILASFPWVVDRLLADIKRTATKKREKAGIAKQHALESVSEIATDQAEHFFNERQVNMTDDFKMRQIERDGLLSILHRYPNNRNLHVALCGASLTELNIGDKNLQPLQVYLHVAWDANEYQQRAYLRDQARILSTLVGTVAPIGMPPYITFPSTKIRDLHYYITSDPTLMLKSAYVSLHVQRCPRLIHLLLVIMHWGRKRHLIGGAKDSFMGIEDLAVFFIWFCEQAKYIQEVTQTELQRHATDLLGITSNQTFTENTWKDKTLNAEYDHENTGFFSGTKPGMALIKFLELYSYDSKTDPLRISLVPNPVQYGKTLFPDLSDEQIQRFADAALHAFHEIAQCGGLDSVVKSADHDNLKEVEESLTLPNCTWGAIRFAEDFVALGLAKLTGAKISVRAVQRGSGYLMEVTGNYLTLYKAQNEVYKLEEKCGRSYAYNHLIGGGKRFIFMNQNGNNDALTVKGLRKGDFAINLVNPRVADTPDSEDERKLLQAVETQLQIFEERYIGYLHGSDKLRISAEYGSIYVQNAHAWINGADHVGSVEQALASADPRNRGGRGKNKTPISKWNSLQSNSVPWQVVFPNADLIKTTEVYVAEIKAGKNINVTVVYDDEVKFKEFQIPPFRWLEVDMKTLRLARSKKADVDIRVIMTSQRQIDSQEAQSLPIYESYAARSLFSKTSDGLSVSPEFRKKVSFLRQEIISVYKINSYDNVFLEVCSSKKYDVKTSPVMQFQKEVKSLKLYGELEDRSSVQALCRNIWSAAKALRPFINLN